MKIQLGNSVWFIVVVPYLSTGKAEGEEKEANEKQGDRGKSKAAGSIMQIKDKSFDASKGTEASLGASAGGK